MNLATKTESLGQAVSQGLITRADAIHELMEFSDGGLTRRGAENVLDRWQTIRADYGRISDDARESLRRLGGYE